MKYVLMIGDGMADNALEELGGKTPLEVSDKPFIDSLAVKSVLGSVRTVPELLPPGSDTAILSIFGCDPRVYFAGRSPLEAAGCDIVVEPGSTSFRCNMIALSDGDAPFDEKTILSHNAGSIDGEESMAFIRWLFAEPEFKAAADKLNLRVEPTPSFRHIAIQKAGDIEGFAATPPHDILGKTVGPYALHGNQNAKDLWNLMALAAQKLEHHPDNDRRRAEGKLPANGIWFWAEGTSMELPNFTETYGKVGSVISAVPLVHGIGVLAGLKKVEVEGATGETDTNYEGKAQAAFDCLMAGDDFVGVHVEAPDEATHCGHLDEKILSIGYIDHRVVKPLCEKLTAAGEDFRLLLISDHKTLTSTRTHDGDPVPFLIYDSTKDAGTGLSYSEANGEKGPFVENGAALMGLLFEQTKI